MKIKSYAKINLALDVLKKSGKYHQIRTVFQQIGLHDEITFAKIPGKKIIVTCDNPDVPAGPKNTIRVAAGILKKYAAKKATTRKALRKNICGVRVHIKKNIPVSAGLGGGSGNGAAALIALNKIWRLKIPQKKLRALAARVGMDAPFFIGGGTAVGTHFGEKIIQLPAYRIPPVIIAAAGRKTSTADLYGMLNPQETGKKTRLTTALVRALKSGGNVDAGKLFHNDFETLLNRKKTVETKALFGLLLKTGADSVGLCGSGPAVYALYKNARARDIAYANLLGAYNALRTACGAPQKEYRTPRKQKLFVWKS